MSWIEETLEDDTIRDIVMQGFQKNVNTLRAQGFHDAEIYCYLQGMYGKSDNDHMRALWPLYDHWCDIFLDYHDDCGGEDAV
jgi:hypothetical protein